MLPVVDKPLIQYAVEEAYAAGIRQMIFVTGRNKRAIEDHFDTAYELEAELEAADKQAMLQVVRSIKPDDMHCMYVRQPKALGPRRAVCQHLVGNEPFAVLLAAGTRGRYYKRVASSNHALVLNEIADLYLQSLQTSWDAHAAAPASLADLSSAKIERFIQRVNDSGRFALEASTPQAAMEKLNYIVNGQPTWAAMLLFAAEPLRYHIHIGASRRRAPSLTTSNSPTLCSKPPTRP